MTAARVTVIDQARDIGPRAFDRQGLGARDPLAASRLAKLQAAADGRDAAGILKLAIAEEFQGQTAIVSSFGSESAVLLHMVAKIDPTTPVLFLNTGKLFGETLRYRDRLQDVLGLTDIRTIGPHPDATVRSPRSRRSLWSRSTDACCATFAKYHSRQTRVAGLLGADHRPQTLPDERARRDENG